MDGVLGQFMAVQRQAEEMADAAAQQVREQQLANFRAEMETLFGAEVLAALEPVWGFSQSWRAGYPSVTLHYRGRQREIVQGEKNFSTRAGLARWLQEMDAEIAALEQRRAEFKAALPAAAAEADSLAAYRHLYAGIRELHLEDDPAVTAILSALKARLEALEQARYEAQVESVLAQYAHVTTWEEYRQIDDYYVRDDARVRAVVQATCEHLQRLSEEQRVREEQEAYAREERRRAARDAAFFPFRYYLVRYGLVAWDEEHDHLCVEPEILAVRHALPDADGWYITLDGRKVKIFHPAIVQLVECRDTQHLPAQAPWVKTEDGTFQVPPAGVERL